MLGNPRHVLQVIISWVLLGIKHTREDMPVRRVIPHATLMSICIYAQVGHEERKFETTLYHNVYGLKYIMMLHNTLSGTIIVASPKFSPYT